MTERKRRRLLPIPLRPKTPRRRIVDPPRKVGQRIIRRRRPS